MSVDEHIRVLELFNSRVEWLERRTFTHLMTKGEWEVRFVVKQPSGETGTIDIEQSVPDEEALDAFALTFRLFFFNNEAISLQNMAGRYETLPVSDRLKEQFNEARKLFNSLLESDTFVRLNERQLTNHELFGTYFYGDKVHVNKPEIRERFLAWSRDQFVEGLLQTLLFELLSKLTQILFRIKYVNEQALIELRTLKEKTS